MLYKVSTDQKVDIIYLGTYMKNRIFNTFYNRPYWIVNYLFSWTMNNISFNTLAVKK